MTIAGPAALLELEATAFLAGRSILERSRLPFSFKVSLVACAAWPAGMRDELSGGESSPVGIPRVCGVRGGSDEPVWCAADDVCSSWSVEAGEELSSCILLLMSSNIEGDGYY